RSLHRAHRWRADAVVPSRNRRAWQKSRNHHRIASAKRHAAPGAACLDRSRRAAMRLLPERHDDGGGCTFAPQTQTHRCRYLRRDHQYLPLRNLSAGAGGDPCRGERGLAAMNDAAKPQAAARYAEKAWQSDVIVDLIKHYGFPYIALNPGASYRGLHDSLVNYGGNNPPPFLCPHEKIAGQIPPGHAQAPG